MQNISQQSLYKEKEQQNSQIQQVVLIGFGAVQKALWTLIKEREPQLFVKWPILIIEPVDLNRSEIYNQLVKTNKRVTHLQILLTEDNYTDIFKQYVLNALVVDLAYRIDTKSIIEQCQIFNCIYINTAIDIWPSNNQHYRSLYHIKEDIITYIKDKFKGTHNTCILNFGANPGLISHFVKYSLMQLYDQQNAISYPKISLNNNAYVQDQGMKYQQYDQNYNIITDDTDKYQFNHIAQQMGLTLIQISERDTSISYIQQQQTIEDNQKTGNRFNLNNTWSVVGFLDEALDNAQISLGTHEILPSNINKQELEQSGQIIINRPAIELKTISYEPQGGQLVGFNIPHAECYSLVQLLRINNLYRPSCYYVYQPCDNCKIMAYYAPNIDKSIVGVTRIQNNNITNKDNKYITNKNNKYITDKVLRKDEIISGFDSLGALMYFRQPVNNVGLKSNTDIYKELKILWTGTTLDNKQLNQLGNEINATTIQVAIGALSAIMWMLNPQNQKRGIIEPEVLPTQYIIDYCKPYLGLFRVNYNCEEFKPNTDIYKELLVYGNPIYN